MTIPRLAHKGNKWLILGLVILLLTASAGFLGGMVVEQQIVLEKGQGSLSIGQIPLTHGLPAAVSAALEASSTPINAGGQVVASKTGKNYYLPWCNGVKRLKPANMVWFASAEEAQAKGYKPAKACPGL